MQHLERDSAIVTLVVRPVHDRHAAAAELSFDAVIAGDGLRESFTCIMHWQNLYQSLDGIRIFLKTIEAIQCVCSRSLLERTSRIIKTRRIASADIDALSAPGASQCCLALLY
jgi:hypothetical protein